MSCEQFLDLNGLKVLVKAIDEKIENAGKVSSVNGQTGAVAISTDDGDIATSLVTGLFDNDEPAGVENPSEYYTKDAADTKFATKASVPTVTDTYSPTSTSAMSGKAVKQAIDEALGDIDSVLTQLGV